MVNIDWTTVVEVLGAFYTVLSALSLTFALIAKLCPDGSGAQKVFASIAAFCGTLAAGLHRLVPVTSASVKVLR